jgi:hypothetical protein
MEAWSSGHVIGPAKHECFHHKKRTEREDPLGDRREKTPRDCVLELLDRSDFLSPYPRKRFSHLQTPAGGEEGVWLVVLTDMTRESSFVILDSIL